MATRFFSERNLTFLLHEVFNAEELTGYEYYREHHRKTFDMVIKAAARLAKSLLYPVFTEMDRKPPEWADGRVKVHPLVPKVLKEFGNGGWITSRVPFNLDGEQLPHLIADACDFIFQAANYSAHVYPALTTGAAHLIESFGSPYLYETYIPNMHSGKWQGTMALTEPEAGSSLSDIATTAEQTDQDHYLIKGQKVFISAGDHDGAENVIHLLLAKLMGAPAGVKGISLFVVPQKRKAAGGKLSPNDVSTSGIYHKLGYKGCPIVQLSFGDANDCRGWLVGEPNLGLRYMFQMMNEFRIGVGLGAVAMATAAYYAALDYARDRKQGRKPSQKDPTLPPVAIIEHADIRRMLLFQRAVVEGSLSLLMQCSKYVDLIKAGGEEGKEKYRLLLEILTPVAKSYPSEMAIQTISQGLQIFGGSGYCDDYPMEQYYRDVRIHPIHEGTTGIQAMDLLGRKILMHDGQALKCFEDEVKTTISAADAYPDLQLFARQLMQTLESLNNVTRHLMTVVRKKGIEYYLADATLYLEFFGISAIGWQWLLQGVIVQQAVKKRHTSSEDHFYRGKMSALRYFYKYEIPKTIALTQSLMDPDSLTVDMISADFT